MGDDKWYRKTTWTPEDEEAFFERLKRCRSSYKKAQYVRIQASYLQHASPPNYLAAIELLNYLFREFPDPNELSMAHLQKAQCLNALGSDKDTVEELRDSVREDLASGPRTTAVFDYAMLVVSQGMKHLYGDVIEALSKLRNPEPLLVFPFLQYQAFAAMAIIGYEDGKIDNAQEYSKKALEAWERHRSGQNYPKGAKFPDDPYPEVHAKLLKLAKGKKQFWKLW